MPTYQYACTACGEPLEAVQSFTDAALTDCPACGGRLRKVFSAVGVVFKGSGFYKTDSRPGAGAQGGETGGKGSETGDKGGAQKDGKPAESKPGSPAATPAPAAASSGSSPAPAGGSTSTPAAKTA